MAHRYLNDDALAALNKQDKLTHPATRYSVHESIKPNSYRTMGNTFVLGLTDTLVTRSDGTQYVIPKNNNKSGRKSTAKKVKSTTVKSKTQVLHERMMQLPTIHNPNE